jgi:hypothetical protein
MLGAISCPDDSARTQNGIDHRPPRSQVICCADSVSCCQGTLLRHEIEAREAGKLDAATDYAASAIADKHGSGEVAAKIQAHVIVAVAYVLACRLLARNGHCGAATACPLSEAKRKTSAQCEYFAF